MSMLLKTKPLASEVSESIIEEVNRFKAKGIHPRLSVILVEGDPASAYYAKAKEKKAQQLGIAFDLISFTPEVTEQRLLDEIEKLNQDPAVHGIMLELPLPKHIRLQTCCDAIRPEKDVDGISSANKLACMTGATTHLSGNAAGMHSDRETFRVFAAREKRGAGRARGNRWKAFDADAAPRKRDRHRLPLLHAKSRQTYRGRGYFDDRHKLRRTDYGRYAASRAGLDRCRHFRNAERHRGRRGSRSGRSGQSGNACTGRRGDVNDRAVVRKFVACHPAAAAIERGVAHERTKSRF